MNFLDIIFAVFFVWFAYNGFKKGFIIEITSLAALILGIYVSINFSFYAADFLNNNFEINPKYMSIISFMITLIVVVFLVYMVGKILEKFIDIIMLGFLNKLAGSAFGIIKAAFILSVLIFIINYFDDNKSVITEKSRNNSLLYEPVSSFAPTIIPKLNLDKLKEITKPIHEELENL